MTLAQRRRGEFPPARDMPTPDVRLYHRAVVVAQDVSGQLRGLVRQLSIDQVREVGQQGVPASKASKQWRPLQARHIRSARMGAKGTPCQRCGYAAKHMPLFRCKHSVAGMGEGTQVMALQPVSTLLILYHPPVPCLQFENESRRVSMGAGISEPATVRNKTPLFERTYSEPVGVGNGRQWERA